jgi:hypothetical protein
MFEVCVVGKAERGILELLLLSRKKRVCKVEAVFW